MGRGNRRVGWGVGEEVFRRGGMGKDKGRKGQGRYERCYEKGRRRWRS